MFRLAGLTDPEARATSVVALESAIAQQQISLADSEDIHKANNPWRPSDFNAKAPGLDWPEFFRAAGLDKQQQTFIVWLTLSLHRRSRARSLAAHRRLEKISSPITSSSNTPTPPPRPLPKKRFAFFGTTLSGATKMRPRDFRADVLVSNTLGDAVGQIYAQRPSSPPRPKPRPKPSSPTSSSPSARVSENLYMDGSRHQRKKP